MLKICTKFTVSEWENINYTRARLVSQQNCIKSPRVIALSGTFHSCIGYCIYVGKTTVAVSIVRIKATNLHSQKRASCSKSVDILQQLVATSRYQDAFAWLATACENKSVASCQQACCKLSTGLLQVVNRLVAC